MARIVIFGAGWLGGALERTFLADGNQVMLSRSDIADISKVQSDVQIFNPDVLVNAAGKTGRPNIDWCEASEENRRLTERSNVFGPMVLRLVCEQRGLYLVHLSSGCIFNGGSSSERKRPFCEVDTPCPNSYYGQTKVEAERVIADYPNLLNLRLRMPFWGQIEYDGKLNSRDLLGKLLGYKEVLAYESNSITYVPDLLETARVFVKKHMTGFFHVTNPGPVTHGEILDLYKEIVDPKHEYAKLTLDEFVAKGKTVTRRSNCVLDTNKLAAVGVHLPDTMQRLREAFAMFKNRNSCFDDCTLGKATV